MTPPTDIKDRIICSNCQHLTWHQIAFSQNFQFMVFDDDAYMDDATATWQILQCLGCGSVTAKMMFDYKLGDEEFHHVEFYPERTDSHHKVKFYFKLPENLHHLYIEISNAFNGKNFILCAAGLRALLEGICLDRGINEGPNENGKVVNTLEGKINGLAKIVPQEIVKNLHGFRFLGNQALHELEKPEEYDLRVALNVIEDIMNIIYELNYKSKYLFEKTSKKR